jgi:hypothetical protein
MARSYSALYRPTDRRTAISLPRIMLRLDDPDYRFPLGTRLPHTIALATNARLPNPRGARLRHELDREMQPAA